MQHLVVVYYVRHTSVLHQNPCSEFNDWLGNFTYSDIGSLVVHTVESVTEGQTDTTHVTIGNSVAYFQPSYVGAFMLHIQLWGALETLDTIFYHLR